MNLLDEIRAKIKELLDQRARAQEEMDGIVTRAERRGDGQLTEAESARFDSIRTEIRGIDEKVGPLREREGDVAGQAADRARGAAAARRYDPHGDLMTIHTYRTYEPDGSHSFIRDAIAVRLGTSPDAEARLHAHQSEAMAELSDRERRDVGTSAFGGLVIPQHLVDEFAEVLRASAPFLGRIRDLPLPEEGMTLIVPRGETGTSVEAQATENTAVSETDADFDNDLSVPVRTFAGQQDLSRQAIERGRNTDTLIYADLAADYVKKADASAIAGDGTLGTHKGVLAATGVNSVTYTSAAPTIPEIWPKLADGIQRIGSLRFMAADTIFMHPRRWGWILAALDASDRPLVVPTAAGPNNAFATVGPPTAEGAAGTLQNVNTYLDANIPTNLGAGTNEDRIIICRSQDLIVWSEDGLQPRTLRVDADGAGNLTVKLVAYGYTAFTAERFPVAVSIISGTGLVAPSF